MPAAWAELKSDTTVPPVSDSDPPGMGEIEGETRSSYENISVTDNEALDRLSTKLIITNTSRFLIFNVLYYCQSSTEVMYSV